jgi:hypothetical protein
MIEGTAPAARESKHSSIFHAIQRLETVVDAFDDLLLEVQGGGKGKGQDVNKTPMPSLGTVLSETATNILSLCDKLDKIKSDLRKELF